MTPLNAHFSLWPSVPALDRARLTGCLLSLALLAGCASTEVTNHQPYQGPKLPRPAQIIVYDFAATPEDIPGWSEAGKSYAESGASVSDSVLTSPNSTLVM